MEFTYEDCKSLVSQVKHEEKQLRLKRRWLMGLYLSKSERKQLERFVFQKNRILPESLLREDDVSYDIVNASVQKVFGLCNAAKDHNAVQDNLQLLSSLSDLKNVSFLLDNMTNKGLCLFAEIVTGDSMKFEKTRKNMKKLAQLLEDHRIFHFNCVPFSTPKSESCHAAAIKILDELEDLPFQTLSAMHRKLRRICGYIPKLQPSKSGWGRDSLIDQVRKQCLKMLSEVAEGKEMQEPLAKALSVASLTQKLLLNCPNVTEFQRFSPEIVALQNDIVNAIWLLDKKVKFPELKNLQFLLDPNAELSSRSLRGRIRNLLTEYLLECDDMDTIPEYLFETLAIINRGSQSYSRRPFSKEEAEEEVECVLSVSAQVRQIFWDLHPEYEFDQDFSDVYIEDLEESDDGDAEQQMGIEDNISYHSIDHFHVNESFGEINIKLPASTSEGDDYCPSVTHSGWLNGKFGSRHTSEMASVDSCGAANSPSYLESKDVDIPQKKINSYQFRSPCNSGRIEVCSPTMITDQGCSATHFPPDRIFYGNSVQNLACGIDVLKYLDNGSINCLSGNTSLDNQSSKRNSYLAVQEESDETSMIAHSLIGCILHEYAQREILGLDWRDVSYLRSYGSTPRNYRVGKEELTSAEDVVIQVLDELIPTFPISGKEKLKDLMGLK